MKTFYEMLSFLEDDMKAGQENMNQQSPGGQQTPQEEGPQEMEDGLGDESSPGMDDSGEVKHYMFFNNLKVIKEKAEAILAMDQAQVDAVLSDGHDWASDHISTSKDDMEEVYNWLSSEIEEGKNESTWWKSVSEMLGDDVKKIMAENQNLRGIGFSRMSLMTGGEGRRHEVRPGDTWESICRMYYGDGSYSTALYDFNRKYHSFPKLHGGEKEIGVMSTGPLKPGMTVYIPDSDYFDDRIDV